MTGQVSPITTYDTLATNYSSAGIAPFNPSRAALYPQNPLAFQLSSMVQGLSNNPSFSYATSSATMACSESADCLSIFYTGGVSSIAPSPYLRKESSASPGDVIKVQSEQGIQYDYWTANVSETLTPDDCHTWGTLDVDYAFQICLKNSSLGDTLLASKFP